MIRRKTGGLPALPIITILTIGLMVESNPIHAFTGSVPGPGQSGGCADFINTPERYRRLPSGQVTFRLTQNFIDRYPDPFSQYLVADSARLLTDFMSTHKYSWINDIQSREHYLKLDYNHTYYGLKGILLHEFSHVMGMQHNDGCYYNTNQETGEPWLSNYHLIGGGNVGVIEPNGLEILNGTPVADFITPGNDVFDFFTYAYPFQSVHFTHTSSNNQVVRVDSTNADPLGGQVNISGTERINPDDSDQGWHITDANLWVGYDNFILYNYNTWYIENTSGHDIHQVTLRVNGTSTRKPIFEDSPDAFTHLGIGTTSSPEQLIYGWSTPSGHSWPAPGGIVGIPGGNPNTEPPRFSLELDAEDTVVQEALMWHHSNQAFEIPIPTVQSIMPWGFSPNTPAIESAAPYALSSLPLTESTPVPDNIEMQSLPITPNPNGTRREFRLTVPQVEDMVFKNIDLLPLSWREAEIFMHQSTQQRSSNLSKQFIENDDKLQKMLPAHQHNTTHSIGFRKDPSLFILDHNSERVQRIPLSKRFKIDFNDDTTYAVRVILSSPAGQVYFYTLPEMNRYMGSRKARCAISGDPESCCPYEMREPVLVNHNWNSKGLSKSSCIVGGKMNDSIVLNGRKPHLLATGDGNDKVKVERSGSTVQLGQGNDYFETAHGVAAHVNGGSGKDTFITSNQSDYIDGGDGNDTLISGEGDDVLIGGNGENKILAGPGDDTIYPGRGYSQVDAGKGNDRVIYTHPCELDFGAKITGGSGKDTLLLPITLSKAKELGLEIEDFENIVEEVKRDSVISSCDQ